MPFDLTFAIFGSVAATLFAVLSVLRFNKGLKLLLRWVRARPVFANSVMIMLASVSAITFLLGSDQISWALYAPTTATASAETSFSMEDKSDEERSARALDSLRAYAARIADKQQTIAALSEGDGGAAANPSLPDVDTMISRLVQRLEASPDDVKGWTMLGWSYLNTQRPADAVKAYEHALQIEPENAELKQALSLAKEKAAPTGVAQQADRPSVPISPSAPASDATTHPGATAN
ncbi:MAG: tetratricopeptide repeat protein [Hyphomicrobium sp.]